LRNVRFPPIADIGVYSDKSGMRKLALSLSVVLSGCASSPASQADSDPMQAIIHQCGMDRKMILKPEGHGKYAVQRIANDTPSDGFMCVVKGLYARGLKVGFISEPRF
jgi:hypothetical protein